MIVVYVAIAAVTLFTIWLLFFDRALTRTIGRWLNL